MVPLALRPKTSERRSFDRPFDPYFLSLLRAEPKGFKDCLRDRGGKAHVGNHRGWRRQPASSAKSSRAASFADTGGVSLGGCPCLAPLASWNSLGRLCR